ncbi:MAG: CHASE sensor domain-containing protein [Planctomycetaceae bacterium]
MIPAATIRSKVLLLLFCALLLVTVVALGSLAYELRDSGRKNAVDQAVATADLLAENATVAVSFGDQTAAEQLMESLAIQPSITCASIVDAEGTPFATYGSTKVLNYEDLQPSDDHTYRFDQELLTVAVPIDEMGEQIGTLVMVTDTSAVWTQIVRSVRNVVAMLSLVLVLAFFTSKRALGSIVQPVLELTRVAKEVAETDDCSLRVGVPADSEMATLCQQFNDMLNEIEVGNRQLTQAQNELLQTNELLEQRVAERTEDLAKANRQLQDEVERKRRAYAELKDLQSQLVETSRAAGMAEIANGVLHNIGNVLNSAMVAANIASTQTSKQRVKEIVRIAETLVQKQNELGEGWVHFEGIKHLPAFLTALGRSLTSDQNATLEELSQVRDNIELISEIVKSQQSFACRKTLLEETSVVDMMDTAFRLVSATRLADGVKIVRDYKVDTSRRFDKHKTLQILSNFVKNGFEAMADQAEPKQMVLGLEEVDNETFLFSVSDSGVGIESETVAKLFQYGFTTKKDGHGFGLHSAACSAKEMGGSVRVESEGPGKGSRFILELPAIATESGAVGETNALALQET